MAPTMRNGSAPLATASGNGASIGSSERSCSQAKKRTNARRRSVTWSRIVPHSIGYRASIASRTDRCVTAPSTFSSTSPSTRANVRKCGGRTILITTQPPLPCPLLQKRRGRRDPASFQCLGFDREYRRKIPNYGYPVIAGICGAIHLAASGAEVDSARIERIDRHSIAQYVDVAIALRQAFRERLPFIAAGAAAINAELSIKREMLRVTLDRHHVNGIRLVRMNVNRKSEISRQIAADFVPRITGVIATHHIPVFLHEEHTGPGTVHGDAMNAVADLGRRVGNVLRLEPAIDRLPGFAVVVTAILACGRNRNEDAIGIARIQNNRVQAHSARAGLPLGARRMAAQPGQFVPGLAAVGGAEDCSILNAGIDSLGIGERGLQVPDAFEFPRMLRPVVPLVRGERLATRRRSVVDKLV